MQLTSFFALATFIASVASAAVPAPAAGHIAKPFPGGGDFRDFPDCAIGCLRDGPTGRCHPGEIGCLCHERMFMDFTDRCFDRRCDRRDEDRAHWARDRACGFKSGGGWGDNGGHGGWGGNGGHGGPGGWGDNGGHGGPGGWGHGGPGGPGGPGHDGPGHDGPGHDGPGHH